MFVLDRLLVGGLRFVLDKVATAVDAELNDETAVREELLELQMRHELGEIDEREMAVRERELLDRLRELRRGEEAGGAISFGGGEGVEVAIDFEGGFEAPSERPREKPEERDG